MNESEFQKRVASAVQREAKVICIQKQDHRWVFTVEAAQPPSRHAVVYESQRQRMTCNCEDYRYREASCFHCIKAAQFLLDCMYAQRELSWKPDALKARQAELIQKGLKNRLFQFSPALFGLGLGEPPAIPKSDWESLVDAEVPPFVEKAEPAPEPAPPAEPTLPPEEEQAWAEGWSAAEAPPEEEYMWPEELAMPGEEPLEAPPEEIETERELLALPRLAQVASELKGDLKFVLSAKTTLLMPDGSWLKLGIESMEFSLPAEKLDRVAGISEALLGEVLALSKSAEERLYAGMERGVRKQEIAPGVHEEFERVKEPEDEGDEGFTYSEEDTDAEGYWA